MCFVTPATCLTSVERTGITDAMSAGARVLMANTICADRMGWRMAEPSMMQRKQREEATSHDLRDLSLIHI